MQPKLWTSAFIAVAVCLSLGVRGRSSTNIYDVLRLMYRMCETGKESLDDHVKCVEMLLGGSGGELTEAAEKCMYQAENETPDDAPLLQLCSRYTQIELWKTKADKPPASLTGVISLAGLTRMMCIMGEVRRPVSAWEAAFSKCFPKGQDRRTLEKILQKKRH
ncbi:uncharacterized protein LOC135399868 [Ornithodoros turicata]|uniref:uncharacterized protein LOC135399868 n=1 Tax=Ornithodoros turicata TaxID=34597 RepID=UPI00313A3867